MTLIDAMTKGIVSSTTAVEQSGGAAQPVGPQAAQSLMPDPLGAMALSDDAISQITGMLALSFRDDRKHARKMANLENQAQAAETRRRVSEMMEKAEATGKAGMIAGATMVAAGGLQMASAATAPMQGGNPVSSTARDMQPGRGSALVSGLCQGGASGVEGGGKISEGLYRKEAEEHDARAVEHESKADAAKRRGETYQGDADDAKRMLDKVADFLREVRTSQNAAASAALYRA